jgi:aspartate aminotransferase-like enzyme
MIPSATDLRIPGPTPVPPQVMKAMQRPMIPHRGASIHELFTPLLEQVRRIHGTEGDVVILPGSGSAGWEAAIVNALSPGDTVISFITGDFGERFADVAGAFGLNVVRVEVSFGEAATVDDVRPALEAHPDAAAVLYTYNETSTGVTNPLAEVGPLVRAHGALLLVDAVSAAAGLPLEMDRWGVDLALSGSQKAWMCPPGLVIIAFGSRVWDAYKRSSFPRFFWDFGPAVRYAAKGETPMTAPETLLYALKAACDMIDGEGLDAVYARHARLGELVRQGLQELGFRPFANPAFASNTVTAVRPPEGLDAPAIIAEVRRGSGIVLAGGQGAYTNEIIRVGHMGWVHEPELRRTLGALKESLERLNLRKQ